MTTDGRVTSHWTRDGAPLPFVPFVDDWRPAEDPPAYVDLYRRSRARFPDQVEEATIRGGGPQSPTFSSDRRSERWIASAIRLIRCSRASQAAPTEESWATARASWASSTS